MLPGNFICQHYANANPPLKLTFRRRSKKPVPIVNLKLSSCSHCSRNAIWLDEDIIFPRYSYTPNPCEVMPLDILHYYAQARDVAAYSSIGALALLRITIEKVLEKTGANKGDINDNIQFLVDNGQISTKTQKALDVIRLIGNKAIHAEDGITYNIDIIYETFEVINIIVNDLIVDQQKINKVIQKMPEKDQTKIASRDKK
jgi:hypothetical protein